MNWYYPDSQLAGPAEDAQAWADEVLKRTTSNTPNRTGSTRFTYTASLQPRSPALSLIGFGYGLSLEDEIDSIRNDLLKIGLSVSVQSNTPTFYAFSSAFAFQVTGGAPALFGSLSNIKDVIDKRIKATFIVNSSEIRPGSSNVGNVPAGTPPPPTSPGLLGILANTLGVSQTAAVTLAVGIPVAIFIIPALLGGRRR